MSPPRADLLGASVPSRSNTKSFLMLCAFGSGHSGQSVPMMLHRPCTTLNERFIHESRLEPVPRGPVVDPSPGNPPNETGGLRRTVLGMRLFENRVTRRIAATSVALVVAGLGLPTASSVAAPTTTTTLPASIVVAGNAYARHLIGEQPIPPQARLVTSLPTPLAPNGVVAESPEVRRAHHFYLLPMSVSVDLYVRSHLLRGEKVTETGTGTSPNANPVYNLGVSLTCVSPHITYCGVFYQTTEAKDGEQELRLDVQVIYLPILHVEMPSDGVVTVTGFGATSLMNPSSDPTSVVLNHHQVLTLRTVIAKLKDLGSNGMCMEDSLLLKIKIVKDGGVVWSATADACPGALTITSAKANVILDNRSCPFWHVVDTFFPSDTANATKSESKLCSSSQYG